MPNAAPTDSTSKGLRVDPEIRTIKGYAGGRAATDTEGRPVGPEETSRGFAKPSSFHKYGDRT